VGKLNWIKNDLVEMDMVDFLVCVLVLFWLENGLGRVGQMSAGELMLRVCTLMGNPIF